MKCFAACVLFSTLLVAEAYSQPPQGAHVLHFFPQVADGAGEWQTSFTFVNPDDSYAVVTLRLFRGDGSGLALDFGSGADDTHAFLIPARGTVTAWSTGTLPALTGGWAFASSTSPVQAMASYRQSAGGIPKLEVAVYPTLPTIEFSSPASNNHGFAIANVHISEPITVDLEIRDSSGVAIGNPVRIENIPALGYKSGYVSQFFPGVNFSGTLKIKAADIAFPRNDEFVAMTLGSDETGLWSGLPPGPTSRPQPYYERLWLAYKSVLNAALKSGELRGAPQMDVLMGNRIDIHIDTEALLIEATLGISQLLDSDSELAYAFGHELGHMVQSEKGRVYDPDDRELDADVWGMIFSMLAGYDPYAAAGALGKLSMASGGANLITESFDDILDPNGSFMYRLGSLHRFFDQVCSQSPGGCAAYRRKFHPNFPTSAVMAPVP